MRHGLMRFLSALIAGTAFAMAVAAPVQWCPCPMHGAALHAPPAHQAMPDEGGAHEPAPSQHADHQCTCPGGCCSSAPLGLQTARVGTPSESHPEVRLRVRAVPELLARVSSPQLLLPFANAP